MSIIAIIQIILAALSAICIYTFIGFIPGTDETSVLMPITLAVVLAGTPPMAVLTFFISAIVTLSLINAIPTALVGLPGGVMSSPMLEHSLFLKEKGVSALVIRKMAAGSLIGVIISIPMSLILANILAPHAQKIQALSSLLFFLGAIFLAIIGRNRILSLFGIIPLAILFMSLRHLYWGIGVVAKTTNITVSFFLGITIGPLIISLLRLLNGDYREAMARNSIREISIPEDVMEAQTLNPFRILNRMEMIGASISALIANFLFVLSPVGLTILLGEAAANRVEDPVEKGFMAITTMSALIQATYISGIIIPLTAIGVPLSPTAIGPGGALFNAPPVFTVDNNLYHRLNKGEFIIGILLGATIAIIISYYIINRFAGRITTFVLRRIPHEAILALFISLIILLAYMDAGLINVFGVLLIGITCGTLNRMGMGYGVQFMTLYAAPWIIEKITLF